MKESKNGNYYYLVKVKNEVSSDGEIYLHADKVEINKDGSLAFYRATDEKLSLNLLISSGNWFFVTGASVFDGHTCCLEWIDGKECNK